MAAKQQVKRKGKIVKKNKLQKKHLKTRQRQKLQSRKFKKHSRLGHKTKRAPKTKAASGEQSKICSPRLFASKILRQMPKVRMEAKARGLMKTLLTDLYSHVATEVETLSQKNNDLSTISCDDVKNFLKDAMAKELAKHSAEPASTIPTTSNTTTTTTTTTTNSA